MPLVDLSMVEQRYDAVREVLDGASVKDTATRYGVDRRTLHRWLVRYAIEGLGALADRSSKPDRCPHQMAPEIEARIVELRRSQPGWGPRTILNKLRRELEAPPSRAAIYRCLVRHRLIQPKPRRRRRDDYKRWERARAMELWQMDVMANVKLSTGDTVSVVTGTDDHSRFCVSAKVVARATARPVCEALLEALNSYGIPEQILTDNGKVFTGKLGNRPANVLFDRICLNNGIRQLSDELRCVLDGIDKSDSVTVDAHKWLSVPMGAGMFLCTDQEGLYETFRVTTKFMPATRPTRPTPMCTASSGRVASLGSSCSYRSPWQDVAVTPARSKRIAISATTCGANCRRVVGRLSMRRH
jgi:transposase